MARYRDVKDFTMFGTAWTGVVEVADNVESEQFKFSADDSPDIERTDLTKLSVSLNVSVKDPQKKRDIRNFVYGLKTFTANATTNELTCTAHGLLDDDIVRLFNSGGALPGGLAVNTNYYVIVVNANTIQLSATAGGSAIDLTSAGTGTHTLGRKMGEVMSASFAEAADEILDSADDDKWIKYCGVTNRAIEASVEMKDVEQVLNPSKIPIGTKADIQFDVMPEADDTGFYHNTKYERFNLYNMIATSVNAGIKHGEINTASISLVGNKDATHNAQIYNTPSDAVATGFEKHVGDTGTVSFVIPAATSESVDKLVTLSNCTLVKAEIKAQHGGYLERIFQIRAVSTDGQTPVYTIADA